MKRVFEVFGVLVVFGVFEAGSVAHAQTVTTAISRDTIRVGDPFRAIVRIELPPGSNIVLSDSVVPTEDVENAGRVRVRRDSTANGVVVAAAYPLTAWRTGPLKLPIVQATYASAAGRKPMSIVLPDINVVSVLPADTAGIKPKPPKDVLGASRLWWPLILAAVLLLAALAALYWWWRRRKRREHAIEEALPMIMPRDRALREIERIAALDLITKKDFKRFYTLLTEVTRQYMQTVEPYWSTYLTTDELTARVAGDPDVNPVMPVLRQGDLVKFARSVPRPEDAAADISRARNWVATYPVPVPDPGPVTAPVPGTRVA